MFGTYRTRLFAFCLLVIAWSSTNAQNSKQPIEKDAKLEAQINAEPPAQSVTLVLTGGGQIVADEVSEDSDGYWYKSGNVSTFIQRSRVSRIDRPKLAESVQSRPIQGNGKWKLSD